MHTQSHDNLMAALLSPPLPVGSTSTSNRKDSKTQVTQLFRAASVSATPLTQLEPTKLAFPSPTPDAHAARSHRNTNHQHHNNHHNNNHSNDTSFTSSSLALPSPLKPPLLATTPSHSGSSPLRRSSSAVNHHPGGSSGAAVTAGSPLLRRLEKALEAATTPLHPTPHARKSQ